MQKQLIISKCRKAYLLIKENRIFMDEDGQEYEFVNLFRREDYALQVHHNISTVRMEWEKYKGAISPTSVVAFYLVPAILVDSP